MGIGIPTRAAPGKHWLTAVGRDGRSHRAGVDPGQDRLGAGRLRWVPRWIQRSGERRRRADRVLARPSVVGDCARCGDGGAGRRGRDRVCLSRGRSCRVSRGGCANDPCRPTWTGRITGSALGPAVGGNSVFVTTAAGRLLAFPAPGCDSDTCAPVWTATAGPTATVAPTVAGDVVYTGASDGTVAAFPAGGCGTDACDPTWTANVGAGVTGAPTVGFATLRGHDLLFVGTTDGRVVALDASDGAKVWTVDRRGSRVGLGGVRARRPEGHRGRLRHVGAGSADGRRRGHRKGPVAGLAGPRFGDVAADGRHQPCLRRLGGRASVRVPGHGVRTGTVALPATVVGRDCRRCSDRRPALGRRRRRLRHPGQRRRGRLRSSRVQGNVLPGTAVVLGRRRTRGGAGGGLERVGLRRDVDGPTGRVPVSPARRQPLRSRPPPTCTRSSSPIRHVVVIYQENHSFDEVLGYACWHWTHPDAPAPEAGREASRPGHGV